MDDTLIDTSGSITPAKYALALNRMQKNGLKLPDGAASLDKILQMDQDCDSSVATLKKYLQTIEAEEKFYSIGLKALQGPLPKKIQVQARKGALEFLKTLFATHTLCLVSIGTKTVQLDKLRKAGIDFSLFSIISILPQSSKGITYQEIVQNTKVKASQVVVCGDRVMHDLAPAKELGFTTIHVCFGRGRKREAVHQKFIDFEVVELEEILTIIKSLEGKHVDNL